MNPNERTETNHGSVSHIRTVTDDDNKVIIGFHESIRRFNLYDISVIEEDGIKNTYYWYRHKIGSPAYYNNDGDILWYVKGKQYNTTQEYCEACGLCEYETSYWVLKYGHNLPTRYEVGVEKIPRMEFT